MTPDNEKAHREGLERALKAGYEVLQRGGPSLDAVVAAIRVLEDDPLFNAGTGAGCTHEGTNELDASIMDGKTLNAGAVGAVKHIRNPISLARIVMEGNEAASPNRVVVEPEQRAENFAFQHARVETFAQRRRGFAHGARLQQVHARTGNRAGDAGALAAGGPVQTERGTARDGIHHVAQSCHHEIARQRVDK